MASPPMSRHALINPAQKVAHTPEELQSQAIPNFNETNGDKMNKVRVIEFSATPRAKTPDNAARRERRKTKVVPRTISPLHPTRRCGDGFTEGMEMLEASRMDRTDVTQGDLEELCELSLRGNMRQEDVPCSNPGLLDLGFATSPSSELLKPGEGSTHTPASVEWASRTLTETAGLEAGLVRVKEAEQAALQSNNNNTGSCGGQCVNNDEGG